MRLHGAGEKPELQADLRHERREAEDERRRAEVRGEDDRGARAHLRVGIGEGEPALGQQRHDERRDADEDERNAAVDGPARDLNLRPERPLGTAAEVAVDHAPAAQAGAERIDVDQVVERVDELSAARGRVQTDRDPARTA